MSMDNKINFTQEELQLIYAACMSYGDKLAEIKKSISNEKKIVLDNLTDRAKESWNLARKITEYMEDRVMRSPLSSNLTKLIKMDKKMYSFDIVEYEKGIVFSMNKTEAEKKVKDYYRNKIKQNVDDMKEFEFYVSEIILTGESDVIITVPW